jgi:hypothetical protein
VKDETEWPIQAWRRRYDNFSIEVMRRIHPRPTDPEKLAQWQRDGRNRWFVYAYIYLTHWHFAKFAGNDCWQPATDDMPLHGGCTFLEYHWKQGETGLEVQSVKVGADYTHLGDMDSHDDDGRRPFRDAVALANWLLIREVAQ